MFDNCGRRCSLFRQRLVADQRAYFGWSQSCRDSTAGKRLEQLGDAVDEVVTELSELSGVDVDRRVAPRGLRRGGDGHPERSPHSRFFATQANCKFVAEDAGDAEDSWCPSLSGVLRVLRGGLGVVVVIRR